MSDLAEAVDYFRYLIEKRNLKGMNRKDNAIKKKHGIKRVENPETGDIETKGDVGGYRSDSGRSDIAQRKHLMKRKKDRDNPWSRDHERNNTPTGQQLKKRKHKGIAGQRRGAPEKEQSGKVKMCGFRPCDPKNKGSMKLK